MKRRAFLAGLSVCAPLGAKAATTLSKAKALSGARFEADGQEFLLADVTAPPLYRLTQETPAHFEQSRRALETLLKSEIEIVDAMPPTRWGVRRVLAKPHGGDQSLQALLAADGAVRVTPQSADHERIKTLLAVEGAARQARRGLWALPEYQLFQASDATGAIGFYHLVEGTVLRAEKHGSRFYLNFGEDFRSDFTAGAASALYGRWLKNGFDLAALQAVMVRVRGEVEYINGPSIDVQHPLQIEVLA